jgi:hypothetical protein
VLRRESTARAATHRSTAAARVGLLMLVAVMLAVVLASGGGSPAAASGTFCSKFVKNVSQFDGSPVAVTRSNGVIFYRDKKSKSAFYVCAPKSKSSSQSQDVDGATSFKVVKFAAASSGRCALAFVRMKGHPTYSEQEVGPLMVSEFHLAPNSNSGNSITANLTGPIGKVAFSTNCFSAWAAGSAGPGYTINVADTANRTLLENPNYGVGGVRVTTATDATSWTLEAIGKDVVLHYTDNGQPLTRTFTYKAG